ncbi:MAG: response regulator [Alphaproteobacteria bacterium]
MDKAQDLAGSVADDEDDQAANETLRRLLALYCDSAHEQTARLARVAARADEHANALIDCWKVMQAATNRMVGTAQSLGLVDFSGLVARFDDKLEALIAGDIGTANLADDVAKLAEACAHIDPHDAHPFAQGPLAAIPGNRRRRGGELVLRDAIVMVADEDVISRELIRAILQEEGAQQVITVRNGHEALQQAQLISPSLVIADWRMTPGSGRELLHMIRNGETAMHTSTPFIILTRLHALGGRRAMIEEGANFFLEKPFTRERLLTAVRASMGFSANDATEPAHPPRRVGSAA